MLQSETLIDVVFCAASRAIFNFNAALPLVICIAGCASTTTASAFRETFTGCVVGAAGMIEIASAYNFGTSGTCTSTSALCNLSNRLADDEIFALLSVAC